jgi:L-cystine uptake protein TcyP (sodium:dicarboxylate symporter family)
MPFDPKEILRVSYVVGWTVVVVTGAAGKRGIAAATAAVLAAMALCFRIMNLVEGVWPAQDMTDSPLVLTGLIAATCSWSP